MKWQHVFFISSSAFLILFQFYYFYSIQGILVTEVIPEDQDALPRPGFGDRIEVYGPWVEDQHALLPDWNEIHPVRHLKIENGIEGGSNGTLTEGVEDPERLKILDPENPYRTAKGTVVDVFENPEDGDWHIHISPDPEYQRLAKSGRPPFYFPVYSFFVPVLLFVVSLVLVILEKKK